MIHTYINYIHTRIDTRTRNVFVSDCTCMAFLHAYILRASVHILHSYIHTYIAFLHTYIDAQIHIHAYIHTHIHMQETLHDDSLLTDRSWDTFSIYFWSIWVYFLSIFTCFCYFYVFLCASDMRICPSMFRFIHVHECILGTYVCT
jgi:hypothetical protein